MWSKPFLFFFLALLVSCSKGSPETIAFQSVLDELKADWPTEAKVALLVPLQGCSKCTDLSIAFAQKHFNDPRFLFVLASPMGEREARIRFPNQNLENSNVLIDAEQRLVAAGLLGGEVVLLTLEQGKVASTKTLSPDIFEDVLAKFDK
jgi:hypothetical protein